MCRQTALLLFALVTLTPRLGAAEPETKGVEFFEKKIRPVLVERCYPCHSAEAQKAGKLRGKLLLDTRAGLLKGGDNGPAVVPGKPKEGTLLPALRRDGLLKMPPKDRLPATVVADFERWVVLGVPDPRDGTVTVKKGIDVEEGRKFWAFQRLARAEPPKVRDEARVRTPVDRFVLAKLEEKKLTLNAPAAREKLIRRAFFDLIGLPPTPAEIDAFLNDTSPDAYAKLLDRLLVSERYGERWARHWLDVARFAESGGYEFDKDRPGAYHYRDFVIKALNRDMPYDQFVRWQLAGDGLLPNDFLATSATGFVVAGPYPGQTTAKTLEPIRYDHLDDMLSTAGSALLGLTLGCARCHDHKFDPIPTRDYYRLLAAFGRTDSADLKLDPEPEVYRRAKAEFDAAHAPLVAAREKFEKEVLPARFEAWRRTEMVKASDTPWQTIDPVSFAAKLPLKRLDDGSFLVPAPAAAGKKGKPGVPETYTIIAHTYQKGITSFRLEALPDASLPKSGPGRGADGGFTLTGVHLTATPLKPQAKEKPVAVPVKLRAVKATFEQADHPLSAALVEKGKGWSVGGAAGRGHAAVFETEGAVGFDGGTVLTLTLTFASDEAAIGRPRLALSTARQPVLDGAAAPQNVHEIQALLSAEKGDLNERNREAVLRWYQPLDAKYRELIVAVEAHARQEPQPRLSPVFAASSGRGGDVYFLARGEVDRKEGLAAPGFLQVLSDAPETRWAGKPAPRVALGDWITDAEQGAGRLLARVIVNRLWQHHFGRGLVATPNDFGAQGARPSHPELLDWLAGELIRGSWKLKPIHRLIMTSAAYTQAGNPDDAALKADPNNHLLWRYPTRRLEAEAVRDALLAVSGTLDTTMYGPGSLDENSPRRSVYLTVKRSRLVPFLQFFDAPEAIQSIGERPATTAATQALALMNSPLVRQRAEKLAQRFRPKEAADLARAVEEAYRLALARRPTGAERDRAVGYIRRQADATGPGARTLDGALADYCQVLLCLNEFLYVD
ncbi:MAG TPA: PSD1 and planctomycete cytochrome C domain-containing protein [Gemmataceae bacterium]|nr:PSD1 and planctomycete cytochrome C domain-containing protein [Gemmataceae bacterium]